MPELKMFTKSIHCEMGKCLYYEANVIKAEYQFYKHKPNYTSKKKKKWDSKGCLLWVCYGHCLLSVFCPWEYSKLLLSQGLQTYCISVRMFLLISTGLLPSSFKSTQDFTLQERPSLTIPIKSSLGVPPPPTHLIFLFVFTTT